MLLFKKYEVAGRTLGMVIGGILLFAIIVFGLYQCDQRRNERAQSKVTGAQAGAQQESGADAINTVSGAGQREAGSEDLTRSNEREIRDAEGAGTRIGPGVDYAGRAALCRREAYRNDPKCKVVKP
jgi:hypothetical protein